jgi:glycerol-3-phosphate dehydrogenase
MERDKLISRLNNQNPELDFIVIGGGATGLGIALDAVSRGYDVALFEQSDFTKSTSSRSTKLVHGGVRYLAQGDVKLVVEALRERGLLLNNAPHLCHNQPFIIPSYHGWEGPFYTTGLMMYDILAGSRSLGGSRYLSRNSVLTQLPTLKQERLKGGTLYFDGQFDDSRLGINLMQSILDRNAIAINYMQVQKLEKDQSGKICGVTVKDLINGNSFKVM